MIAKEYITELKIRGNGDIPQLNSDRMEQFVSISSRAFRGGWKEYNRKVIKNFEVILR